MYGHKLVSAVQDRELKTPEDWSVMVHTLDEFAFAVKKASRLGDLRFAQSGNYAVKVYRPHDKYVLGTLSVKHDAVPADNLRMQYSVYSRTINNKRFAEHNAERNTRSSSDMKKAIKLAVANLRPYKPVELAHRHGSELWSFVEEQPRELRLKMRWLAEEVTGNPSNPFGNNDFEAEIRHLVRSGHSFINPELGDKLAAYFETKDLREQTLKVNHDMVYLRVYQHNNQQLADIALLPHELTKRLEYNFAADYYKLAEQAEGVPIEQLGDNWIGRVSVLSMLQVEQGEPGIGFKADEDEFFVYPEAEPASE